MRKVTDKIFEVEVKGVGLPPPNVTVPAALENVGSVVQRENTEPVFPTLTTESTFGSNFSEASTALTLSPFGTAFTTTVKVCPTPYEPLFGLNERSAACAKEKDSVKNNDANARSEKSLMERFKVDVIERYLSASGHWAMPHYFQLHFFFFIRLE